METKDKVDWVIFEALMYSMAKAVDYLGIQGQTLINRMGEELVNYLVENGALEPSKDPFEFCGRLTKFFTDHGFANRIETRLVEEKGDTFLQAEYSDWSYYDVFRKLNDEKCRLYACPSCVGAGSILEKSGYKVQYAVGFSPIEGQKRTMIIRHRVFPPQKETFSEEEAKKVERQMD